MRQFYKISGWVSFLIGISLFILLAIFLFSLYGWISTEVFPPWMYGILALYDSFEHPEIINVALFIFAGLICFFSIPLFGYIGEKFAKKSEKMD